MRFSGNSNGLVLGVLAGVLTRQPILNQIKTPVSFSADKLSARKRIVLPTLKAIDGSRAGGEDLLQAMLVNIGWIYHFCFHSTKKARPRRDKAQTGLMTQSRLNFRRPHRAG